MIDPTENLRIRELRPGEGSLVASLAAESPTAAHWSAGAYEAVAAGRGNEFCLVAEREPGALCGFLHASAAGGEAELFNIVVPPAERRQGIGSRLFNHAVELLKKRCAEVLWLEVRESNAEAIAFYCSRGFQQHGRRKSYYQSPPEDALVFRLNLGGDGPGPGQD